MNEVKTGLMAKSLLPVILALMLGASLATNVFLMRGTAVTVHEDADTVPCEGFWCSLKLWD